MSFITHPILRYLAIRAAFLSTTFIIVLVIVFIIPRVIPGNPIYNLLNIMIQGVTLTPEQITALERKLMSEFNLDKPLYVQFIDFISNILKGDLGKSIVYYPKKVSEIIFQYLPWTLGLVIPSTVVSWIIGNSLGVFAAYKRRTMIDNVLLPIFIVLSSTPYYWLAMILILVFAANLGWFPLGGAYPPWMRPSLTPEFVRAYLHHYVLPFLSIVISTTGLWATGMRAFAIYELKSDYITYADSLGLPDRRLVYYVFKNSMIPQVLGLALSLGGVLGGSLITEIVFNYPGTGYMLFNALVSLDYTLIQGIFIILTSTLLLSIFILEIVYAIIDPRVRVGYAGG